MKRLLRKGAFSGVWVVPLVIIADRVSKAWAMRTLPGRGPVAAVAGLLNWRYAENTGAAFSSMSGRTGVLSLLTALLVAAVCAWLLLKPDRPRALRLGLWMLAAGGLSNLYDRIAYGCVVDFIEFAFVNFAVFNVADVAICMGAALAVLGYALLERAERRKEGGEGNG